MNRLLTGVVAALLALPAPPAAAEVVRIVIDRREDVLRGRSFGNIGPYEKIVGRVYFAFDPADPMNARIVDIGLAPRNAQGRVEAWAEFMVLRPKFPPPGGGTALLEVSNRGAKASLAYFNRAVGSEDPTNPEHFGDGLVMRLGLTVIWVGWQHDVPRRAELLRLHAPVATLDGEPIRGLTRADWTVDIPTTTLALGHRDHIAYPVVDPADSANVLTVRDGRLAPRRPLPRERWRFAREAQGEVVPDSTSIYLQGGFAAGRIYELVYRTANPVVAGLGLAAVRDMLSYAKYDSTSAFPVRRGIAVGISQTGRFLRHFLYQGFNTDEHNRPVFEGMIVHTAGAGRGSFNHRFAQPSRDAHRYSAFFYPTDLFPFTGRTQADPHSGIRDGLFAHAHDPAHLPKVFYTNTGYEYWGRAASLIHTSTDGLADLDPLPNERIYHLAGGQHFVGRFPPSPANRMASGPGYRGNPLDFLVTLRSLLAEMVAWVERDDPPPGSTYPRIDAGTLVPIQSVRFPAIAGLEGPQVVHEAYRANYGPRWDAGIADLQPPELGAPFPSLVPQVDEYGNERGGVPSVEILVPLATYFPWNLRLDFPGGTHELTDFVGTYVPLARSEEDRRAGGDPRPSIASLYRGKAEYLQLAREAARNLSRSGFLLEEDIDDVLARAGAHWDWLMGN